MKSIHGLIFALSLLLLPSMGQAAVSDGTRIDANFVAPLMQWVEQATGTPVPALPRVTASGQRLKTTLGLEGVRQASSMAAYIPGQVILNNVIWDDESVRSVSYLVHELVHHTQIFSAKYYACPVAMEREAYILQNEWLRQHGEDPIVSARFISQMAACPGEGDEAAQHETELMTASIQHSVIGAAAPVQVAVAVEAPATEAIAEELPRVQITWLTERQESQEGNSEAQPAVATSPPLNIGPAEDTAAADTAVNQQNLS